MSPSHDGGPGSLLSPEEALAVLGDEKRLKILQRLGEASGPLAFSELYDRSPCDTSANFSYHLGELRGHFVHKSDEGYVLRQAGCRVIEAVLAGVQADDTFLERTQVDQACSLCGAPIEVSYRDEHVGLYCSACGGTRDETSKTAEGRAVEASDVLGYLDLPSAGVTNRTPADVLQAALFWTTHEALALARDICPRCSAGLDNTVRVCEDHDDSGGHCDQCGQRFGVVILQNCTNCIYSVKSPFGRYLLDHGDLIAFMLEHEIDPLAVYGFHLSALDETVLSTDPFKAQFSFDIDDESITLTVDNDLSVVNVTRGQPTASH